jgi:hypothetical protein
MEIRGGLGVISLKWGNRLCVSALVLGWSARRFAFVSEGSRGVCICTKGQHFCMYVAGLPRGNPAVERHRHNASIWQSCIGQQNYRLSGTVC